MRWIRFLTNLLAIKREVRREVPPAQSIDYTETEQRTSFSEDEALKLIPTVAKIHSLVSNASNRFRFYVKTLSLENEVLSYKFDYNASSAFADWFVLGYCVFDRNLNYAPVGNLGERCLDTDNLIIARNISCVFSSSQAILSAAYEFYRILNQVLRNAGAHTFATFDANVVLTAKEAEEIRKIFAHKRRKAGPGGVEFISAPLKLQAISTDMDVLKLNEIATLLNREICDLYSIDSSLLNDPENKTYSNKDLALRALYTNTLIPAADRFCESLTNASFVRGLPFEFGFDISSVENIMEDRMVIWNMLKEAYELNIVDADILKRFLAKTSLKDLI